MTAETSPRYPLPKVPTGISGLDSITHGGIPAGRPTLVCGGAGCGKTLLAITFLVNGATQFNEPGVFMSFEERAEDLAANVGSLGYDLPNLQARGRLLIDHVRVERNEIEETGEYDLEGLFVRLGYAVDSIGAKRIVLDTIETLFSGFKNPGVLRAELRRLFGWIKDRGLTAVVTGERGDGPLTRHGLEEYVSDCVILLDNRVTDQITTRRLRVAKYRGSAHGTNEYPFLIDQAGITVLPITAMTVQYPVSAEPISSGIPGLDGMLGKGGFYRGSSILLSGVAGTGKTTFAAHFAESTCHRNERAMLFAFEESADEILRNTASMGFNLDRHIQSGLLEIQGARPSLYGLEMHLARMHRDLERFAPALVVIDPISSFRGPSDEVHAALLRMVDMLKNRGITGIFVTLHADGEPLQGAELSLSSLMDAWVKLLDVEADGERNRVLYVIKARGMSHSNQVREYRITGAGIELAPIYLGTGTVPTGSARVAQQAKQDAADLLRRDEMERRRRDLERRRAGTERQIADLRATLETVEDEAQSVLTQEKAQQVMLSRDRAALAARREAPQ